MEIQEPTHGEHLLESVDLVLSDAAYDFRSGIEDANSHYDVLTLDCVEDAAPPEI